MATINDLTDYSFELNNYELIDLTNNSNSDVTYDSDTFNSTNSKDIWRIDPLTGIDVYTSDAPTKTPGAIVSSDLDTEATSAIPIRAPGAIVSDIEAALIAPPKARVIVSGNSGTPTRAPGAIISSNSGTPTRVRVIVSNDLIAPTRVPGSIISGDAGTEATSVVPARVSGAIVSGDPLQGSELSIRYPDRYSILPNMEVGGTPTCPSCGFIGWDNVASTTLPGRYNLPGVEVTSDQVYTEATSIAPRASIINDLLSSQTVV